MSISSISAPAAPAPIQTADAGTPQTPDGNSDADSDAASPPQLPPLPPGQGTRIDQLA